MNKTVTIRNAKYKMFQYPTGWVFVKGDTSRTKNNSYSIAKIGDGQIIEIDTESALGNPTNQELAEAWLNS